MKKFRRRPLAVHAQTFDGSRETIERLRLVPGFKPGNAYVVTRDGEKALVVPGDWIVLASDDAYEVFSEEEFRRLFEPTE